MSESILAEFEPIPIIAKDELLAHMFRVQAAYCHQFFIFLKKIHKKYPDSIYPIKLDKDENLSEIYRFSHTKYWSSPEVQMLQVAHLAQQDQNTFKVLYVKMLHAKRNFELLACENSTGGTFKSSTKEHWFLEGGYEKFR